MRNKLQLIYQSKRLEEVQQNSTRNDNVKKSPEKIATNQSILGGIAKICSESSTNALICVLQHSGGIVTNENGENSGENSISTSPRSNIHISSPIRNTANRAMGVAALGLVQNETITGDQLLRSKIRSELGGALTTMLHSQNETVVNYYRKNGRDNSSSREIGITLILQYSLIVLATRMKM